MKQLIIIALIAIFFTATSNAQQEVASIDTTNSIIMITLPTVSIVAQRVFKTPEEYNLYQKYNRYASTVYPYAVEAVKIFKQLKQETPNMGYFERKNYIKKLQKDLEDQFETPLKNLSRTQGKILIKMIERKLNTPMYSLLSDLKGGFTATYWSVMGSFYGYKLKRGYEVGEDNIMDFVLQKYNIPD